MIRYFYYLAILTLGVISISLPANARELRLYTESFPPYNFEESGTIKGINADILSELCSRSRISCSMTLIPWKRGMSLALSEISSGIFSTSRTEERENRFQWVGPLVSSNTCLYKLSSRDDIAVTGVDSLFLYTIGIARGDVYENLFKRFGLEEGRHYLTYSNKNDDLRMFLHEKHDLIVSSPLTIESQLELISLTLEDVEPVLAIESRFLNGNYLALNKAVNEDIVNTLSYELSRLKEEGRVDEIIKHYVAPPAAAKQSTSPHATACLTNPVRY